MASSGSSGTRAIRSSAWIKTFLVNLHCIETTLARSMFPVKLPHSGFEAETARIWEIHVNRMAVAEAACQHTRVVIHLPKYNTAGRRPTNIQVQPVSILISESDCELIGIRSLTSRSPFFE